MSFVSIAWDPAGILYTFPVLKPIEDRLDPSDAHYVQVIHTSISLGAYPALGHADFYVNYGYFQPGCLLRFLQRGLPSNLFLY